MEDKFDKSDIEEGKHEGYDVKECDIDEFQCMAQSSIEGVRCIDPIYEYRIEKNIYIFEALVDYHTANEKYDSVNYYFPQLNKKKG